MKLEVLLQDIFPTVRPSVIREAAGMIRKAKLVRYAEWLFEKQRYKISDELNTIKQPQKITAEQVILAFVTWNPYKYNMPVDFKGFSHSKFGHLWRMTAENDR